MRRVLIQIFGKSCLVALLGGTLGLVSCSSGGSSSSSPIEGSGQVIALSEGEGTLALEKKYGMQKGDVTYGENGGIAGGKRSQFEGREQVQYGGNWGGKKYGQQKELGKQSWWGSKKAQVKNFNGVQNADQYKTASRFGSQNANQNGKNSNYNGQQSNASGNYQTGTANEVGQANVARPSNARTDWRRDVYTAPKKIDYKDYQERTIEETRRLLGRDD